MPGNFGRKGRTHDAAVDACRMIARKFGLGYPGRGAPGSQMLREVTDAKTSAAWCSADRCPRGRSSLCAQTSALPLRRVPCINK